MPHDPLMFKVPEGAVFRPCRACRKPITFVKTQSGATMPVDRPESPTARMGQSHYQTCSNPKRFSGKGRA